MTDCTARRYPVKCEQPGRWSVAGRSHQSDKRSIVMAKIQSIEDCPPLPVVEGVELRHCISCIGYAVGSDGSIWSCRPHRSKNTPDPWKQLRPQPNSNGYHTISVPVGTDGKRQMQKVSALVCEAFHGPRPYKMDCCHEDGNRLNDAASNLRWDTRRGNMQDAIHHGTVYGKHHHCGTEHPNAKLTDDQVREIRRVYNEQGLDAVCARFPFNRWHLTQVARGAVWKHVQ